VSEALFSEFRSFVEAEATRRNVPPADAHRRLGRRLLL
jgi:hypothetical protein